jgi:hypothetical protein
MRDASKPRNFRKQLEESLVEIEQYLQKTEESAEAVSPDKGLGSLSRMEAMQDQQLILEARGVEKRCKKLRCFPPYSELRMDNLEPVFFVEMQSL